MICGLPRLDLVILAKMSNSVKENTKFELDLVYKISNVMIKIVLEIKINSNHKYKIKFIEIKIKLFIRT